MKERFSILADLWHYAFKRKKSAVSFLVITIILVGLLVSVASVPALAPFVYPLI